MNRGDTVIATTTDLTRHLYYGDRLQLVQRIGVGATVDWWAARHAWTGLGVVYPHTVVATNEVRPADACVALVPPSMVRPAALVPDRWRCCERGLPEVFCPDCEFWSRRLQSYLVGGYGCDDGDPCTNGGPQ